MGGCVDGKMTVPDCFAYVCVDVYTAMYGTSTQPCMAHLHSHARHIYTAMYGNIYTAMYGTSTSPIAIECSVGPVADIYVI